MASLSQQLRLQRTAFFGQKDIDLASVVGIALSANEAAAFHRP
jgi:hypothetical protein